MYMEKEKQNTAASSLYTVELEASGRHVHLSREAVDALFGKGYQLTKVSELSQPGQFVCKERVAVIGPKNSLKNVVILGPERPEVQVEISRTDAVAIGIPAPVRESGKIENTPGAIIQAGENRLEIPKGVIVAQRHIHITPEDAQRFGVSDRELVSVEAGGERGVTMDNVLVRVSPKFCTYMHIDYDEANAIGFQKGMHGHVIRKQNGHEGGDVCMDLEKLVDSVTKEIMRRLREQEAQKRVLVLEPDCPLTPLLEQEYAVDYAQDLRGAQEYDYVLVPRAQIAALCGAAASSAAAAEKPACSGDGALDFTGKKLIHERELAEACKYGIKSLRVCKKAIITSLAADLIRDRGLTVIREG